MLGLWFRYLTFIPLGGQGGGQDILPPHPDDRATLALFEELEGEMVYIVKHRCSWYKKKKKNA